MMHIIYDIVFFIFAIFYLPCLIAKQKWHDDFLMRFGRFPQHSIERLSKNKNIWIHAVSVGEVGVVLRLIDKIRTQFPSYHIVVSTVTQTGYTLASSNLRNTCTVIYAPLDFSFVVRKFISIIQPEIYINAETELWPNLLTLLIKKNVPVVLINGRISEESFTGYMNVRFIFKRIISGIRACCMQSQSDAKKIIKLGALMSNVHVVGNMKFDNTPSLTTDMSKNLQFSGNNISVLVAGSTHSGEDEIMLDVLKSLSGEYPGFRLVIAPRHIERTSQVVELVQKYNLKPVLFSRITDKKIDLNSVVIIDTIGQLSALYRVATLVFVGKSLVVGGGQNIIEPACCSKPVIVGPHMQNFKSIVDILLNKNAIVQVKNRDDLLSKVKELLADPEEMKEIGIRAKNAVTENQGATARTMEIIASLLNTHS